MESIEQRVPILLSQMTLDGKLAQIGSCWIFELRSKSTFDDAILSVKLKHGIGKIKRRAGASTLDPVSAAKAKKMNVKDRLFVCLVSIK
jgi:beta-glucosidase